MLYRSSHRLGPDIFCVCIFKIFVAGRDLLLHGSGLSATASRISPWELYYIMQHHIEGKLLSGVKEKRVPRVDSIACAGPDFI